jgi:DNA-binding NtrC family response regulator
MDYPGNILIADDEDSIRFTLEQVLKQDGLNTETAVNGKEAVDAVRQRDFDLVLMDMKMPQMDGMEALQEIKKLAPNMMVIMMTAYGSRELAIKALQQGAYDYFSKPFDVPELRIVVKRALEKRKMQRDLEELKSKLERDVRFDKLIGGSDPMQEVFRLLKRVCVSDVTVLIHGESGTGKELIAQAVHFNSNRSGGPFVSINCAAIPENLLESELFGHERGAFTGAVAAKPGRFELANKGTIFLDEIGDMPAGLQAKMLRILQERVVERVGGTKTTPVDVRIVAATNKNLQEEVDAGNFREDLFFRLNVVPIIMPRLADRGNDVILLAEHFLKIYNQKFERNVRGYSQEAIETILRYPWPGNVRELENAVQRSIILCNGDMIQREDLPPNLYQSEVKISEGIPDEDNFDTPLSDKISQITERYEKIYIMSALQKGGYHRQDSADLLGISRKSLHNKMIKYGLFNTEEERDFKSGSSTQSN